MSPKILETRNILFEGDFANLSKDRYLITWGRRLPGCLTFDPPSVERRVKLKMAIRLSMEY